MPDRTPEGTAGFLSRRGFIKVVAASAAALALPACSEEWKSLGFQPKASMHTPFVTPSDDFYLVAVDPSFRPALSMQNVTSQWSLELVGLDGKSQHIGYDELSGGAGRSVFYTFECIGNSVGGQLIGNAEWQVIPLRDILKRAGGLNSVRSVMFEGLDDFYSSVSLERATDDYAFIAVQMNGLPLPAAHGFPARTILPDLYGMKQPRWLKRIVLQEDAATTSYWEKRGWSGEVPIKTMSRLDLHPDVQARQNTEFTGIAFAGARGIAKVEISLDGGKSWVACELVTGDKANVWSLWRYIWPMPTPGRYDIQLRATDGKGGLQTAQRQRSYPDGASGYDQMAVTIMSA